MKTGFAVIILLALVFAGIALHFFPGNWLLVATMFLLITGLGAAMMAFMVSARFARDQKMDYQAMRLYERDISERLAKLEHRIELASETDVKVDQLALDGQEFENSLSKLEHQLGEIEQHLASGQIAATTGNLANGDMADVDEGEAGQAGNTAKVINLGVAAEARKKKQSGDKQAKGSEIGEGKLNLEPLLQPVVSLPHKGLAYYEAFARLVDANGEFVEASRFLPELEKAGRIAEVDLEILNSIVALIRKLQRDGREAEMPGVFWNVSANSLAEAKDVDAIRAALKANAPLASVIIPELDVVSVENASVNMQKEIGALTNQGYHLSLEVSSDWEGFSKGHTGRNMHKVVTRLIAAADKLPITFLKVPARMLLVYKDDSDQTLVDMMMPQLAKRNITLVGTQVEREEQAIGLIDNYIEHAQGSFICPPKPVRPDNSGKSNAASTG